MRSPGELGSRASYPLAVICGAVLGALAATWAPAAILALVPLALLVNAVRRLRLERASARVAERALSERNAALEEGLGERTEQLMRVDAELQAANAQLSEVADLKSAFVSGVTHELRTPLNAIIGFSELLSRDAYGPLEPKQRHCAKSIHDAGKDLLSLIRGVLDFSKVERGDAEFVIKTTSLGLVLGHVLHLVEPLARNRDIELAYDTPGEAGQSVRADPALLQQVLWNLLNNAIKFTDPGGRVAITTERGEAGVTIAIRDTGVGIAADQLERIFHDFYQVDGARTRQHGGTGLGLALVKRYTDLMHARIRVESEPGEGTCFEVFLPDVVEQPAEPRAAVAAS